jgi:poly(3-hydroxybutyrate) depolymerase
VAATKDFFIQAGADGKDNIRFVNDVAAGHAFITPNYGNACGVPSQPPYISKCGYDQAGQILRHIYGEPKPAKAAHAGKPGRLVAFSQVPFAKAATDRAMESTALDTAYLAETGYLYVPPACDANETCKVHVVFHGCHQGAEMDKDNHFVLHTGYNEWADQYNVVLLYPQASMGAIKNPNLNTSNPKGCWDWFGYTNADYAYKNGYQMKAVKGMIDALAKSNL